MILGGTIRIARISHGRANLRLTFDIFRKLPGDGPIWIEAVQGLEPARSRLRTLVEADPGDYFLFDPACGKIIASYSGQCNSIEQTALFPIN
jgi:hypothetical protein